VETAGVFSSCASAPDLPTGAALRDLSVLPCFLSPPVRFRNRADIRLSPKRHGCSRFIAKSLPYGQVKLLPKIVFPPNLALSCSRRWTPKRVPLKLTLVRSLLGRSRYFPSSGRARSYLLLSDAWQLFNLRSSFLFSGCALPL